MGQLQDLGEFGFIQRIQNRFPQQFKDGVLGMGDDCAIIPVSADRCTLVTTDMLIQNVHFLLDAISPDDLGYKSLAVSISDISAMGGHPTYAFVSIGIPQHLPISWLDSFYDGFFKLCQAEGILLLGGDTTSSQHDLVVNVCLLGEAVPSELKLRSFAKPKDLVCVTGTLGDSGAGLRVLLESLPKTQDADVLVARHHHPRLYTQEAKWLAKSPYVHAMMDVSDGIDSDIRHILHASKVGARIQVEQLPLSKELLRYGKENDFDLHELALTGGEDYCLLFTLDSQAFQDIAKAYHQAFSTPFFVIGEITEKADLEYKNHDQEIQFGRKGYDHFRSGI